MPKLPRPPKCQADAPKTFFSAAHAFQSSGVEPRPLSAGR
eukprot:CAMPEP_0181435002 /NCGR_PEP_ID=MMETSP1110-20121109/20109_1 /TAXON_ID=174948 /ORGANISM="Symbiodinium sp., Strain CCMP421" /LENGTH=39 /DNA_ID=CAMNT_0023558525 /DNA_START=239 /DNA_END=358 /DNA_ORIENTATION=+